MDDSLRDRYATMPLYGGNASFVEPLYEQYLCNPESVEPKWRNYFASLGPEAPVAVRHPGVSQGPVEESAMDSGLRRNDGNAQAGAKQGAVSRLIQVYSNRGHLTARLDPLGLMQRPRPRVLELGYFGLSDADLDGEFLTGSHTVKTVLPGTLLNSIRPPCR